MLAQMLRRHAVAVAQPITYIGTATVTSASGSVDLSGLGLQANDIVILASCIYGSNGSADLPSGWTNLYNLSGTYRYRLSYKRMTGTPDTSVVAKSVASYGAAMAMAFRNVHATTAIDATTKTGLATLDPPSITTVTAKAMVVPGVFGGGTSTIPSTAPTGYGDFNAIRNNDYAQNECVAMSSKIRDAAGAENPSTYDGALSGKISFTIALRPA